MAATVDVAQDMTSIDSGVAKVEKAIARVEEEIKDVDKRIVEAEAYLDSLMKNKSQLGFSKEDKLVEQRLDVQIQEYKDRLQHLRTVNQQLRTKEQQLRTEEQQLRTEKQQLRTKEPTGSASTRSASRIGGYLGYTIFIMMLAVLQMSKSVTERPTLVELLKCCAEQGTWPLTTVGNIADAEARGSLQMDSDLWYAV